MASIYNINNIREYIVTLLQGVMVGSNPAFAAVFDYPNPQLSGYPSVILQSSTDKGDFLDTITNLHVITFKIWIVQEITQIGQEGAVASLDACSGPTILALELLTSMDLGGNVMWTTPTSSEVKQVQTPNGPVYYKEIILKCKSTVQIV